MSGNSFLPDDYVAKKTERRTSILNLALFSIVMVGVLTAFLFTNSQWKQVRSDEQAITTRFEQAAQQITELRDLEQTRRQLMDKADLAQALVERVPRSILLAELINRMPPRLSLIEFALGSEQIKPIRRNDPSGQAGRLGNAPQRGRTVEQAAREAPARPEPTRYLISIAMTGVAPTDLDVSRYMASLNAFDLLHAVRLEVSEEKEVDGRSMRQFRITMKIDPEADIRTVDTGQWGRFPKNPMDDTVSYGQQESTARAAQESDQ